jgi:hypothetical protein
MFEKYDYSPLQNTCRNAYGKILSDPELRCWFWCLIAEELGGMAGPVAVDARYAAGRILNDAKDINIDAVHLAEKEYRARIEEDRTWRKQNGREDECQSY